MGREATCTARHAGKTSAGKALLETAELRFRGDFRVVVRFQDMTNVSADASKLTVGWAGGTLVLDLGSEAQRWAQRIRNPPSRLDKLGVKPASVVAVLAAADARPSADADLEEFVAELNARGAQVVRGVPADGATAEVDLVFLFIQRRTDLGAFSRVARSMRDDAALWAIRPKGGSAQAAPGAREGGIGESEVRASARAAGLVDVKVAAFSATRTAEKLVIPVAARGAPRAVATKTKTKNAPATMTTRARPKAGRARA